MDIKPAYCFDDILLVPQYSEVVNRSDIDLSTNLGKGLYLNLPIISAPMDTVTEDEMAITMTRHSSLGIIHRYNSIEEQIKLLEKTLNDSPKARVGAAIGVTTDYLERAKAITETFLNKVILCLDIAHGHHILMKTALETLRKELGPNIHLMAGNVATAKAYRDLSSWGADSIKVSIGSGASCETRVKTGHGIPTLQAIIDCAKEREDQEYLRTIKSFNWEPAAIIADGGLKNSGDIVKSLALGADAVMVGSLLAGTDKTPGDIISNDKGEKTKTFRGMSSLDAQMNWRGFISSSEGISTTIPYKGTTNEVLEKLTLGIRSGLSYSGAFTIKELQEKAQFKLQTALGLKESHPHIL